MKEHMEVKINKLKQKICMFVYVCVPEERQRLCPGKTVYKCETRLLNLTFSAQWELLKIESGIWNTQWHKDSWTFKYTRTFGN